VIWKLFEIWPTAEAAAGAVDDTLAIVEKLIQPLGLFRKRTIAIKRFSQEYLETDVRHLQFIQPLNSVVCTNLHAAFLDSANDHLLGESFESFEIHCSGRIAFCMLHQ